MKVMERNVMRLVAVQHLRTAYGIKTKNWSKNKAASWKPAASSSVSLKKKKQHIANVQHDLVAFHLPWLWNFRTSQSVMADPRINKFTLVSVLDMLLHQICISLKACPHRWDPSVLRPLSPMSVTADALFGCSGDDSHHTFLYQL